MNNLKFPDDTLDDVLLDALNDVFGEEGRFTEKDIDDYVYAALVAWGSQGGDVSTILAELGYSRPNRIFQTKGKRAHVRISHSLKWWGPSLPP